MYPIMETARFRDGCSPETLGNDIAKLWNLKKTSQREVDAVLHGHFTSFHSVSGVAPLPSPPLIPTKPGSPVTRMRCRKNGQLVPILEKPGKDEVVLCECRELVPDSDECLHAIMSKGSMMPAGEMLAAGNADNIRKLLGDDFKVTLLQRQPKTAIKTIVVPAHELIQGS